MGVGFCSLLLGLLVSIYPLNAILTYVGFVVAIVGYLAAATSDWYTRILKVLIALITSMFILQFFYTPRWMSQEIVEALSRLTMPLIVIGLVYELFLLYRRYH